MPQLFSEALDRVQADDDIRAVVISGRPGQFSAGLDLDVLMIGGQQRDRLLRDTWQQFGRVFTLAISVVVARTGSAVAAGAALLLTADRRVDADGDFTIGFNEAATDARMYRPQDALAAGFFHRIAAPMKATREGHEHDPTHRPREVDT
ncbi:enoyl-CoA hydratase-related protein [Mycobacterium sp. NPDC048908]|uniref:enoyl-CoA hydratase-related protein n=1 Tax=Mycobacterium sp. NPDC048908 TaxID=3364292 RepID=UPI00371877A6